jgi:hypothetical protein
LVAMVGFADGSLAAIVLLSLTPKAVGFKQITKSEQEKRPRLRARSWRKRCDMTGHFLQPSRPLIIRGF